LWSYFLSNGHHDDGFQEENMKLEKLEVMNDVAEWGGCHDHHLQEHLDEE
jgi:hypothetical protein